MIFLGKEQLFIVMIILVVCCVYFIVEYLVNSMNEKKSKQAEIENFQGAMMNQRNLDDLKVKNTEFFDKMIEINDKEATYYAVDIKMAARFISKKFDFQRIISRKYSKAGTSPSSELFGLSQKFNTDFLKIESNLTDIVTLINEAINLLVPLNSNDNKSQAIYTLLNDILTEKETMYSDMKDYYNDVTGNKKYLDPEELKDIVSRRANNPGTQPSLDFIDDIRDALTVSNIENKKSLDKIRDKSQELLEIVNADIDVNKNVKQHLLDLFANQRDIFKKVNIRKMGYYLPELVVSLVILEEVSDKYVKEKQTSVRESNKIADDIVNLFTEEKKTLNNIKQYFTSKSSFMIDDNQFKYFNTMDKNTKVLSNFCRKIKQMNRPKNNSLLFKRLTREFIKKKNEQIGELNGKIDGIMNEMNVKETHNKNLYNIRTSEDAQKQINAINKAKENIQNMGKLKINIK